MKVFSKSVGGRSFLVVGKVVVPVDKIRSIDFNHWVGVTQGFRIYMEDERDQIDGAGELMKELRFFLEMSDE